MFFMAVVMLSLAIGMAIGDAFGALIWPLLILELGLLGTALWVWMLIACAINEPTARNEKLIWVLAILLTKVLRATIYLLVRRPRRLAEFES
jgi:hypothetical protein